MKIGPSTVASIARAASIKRSTAYTILENLSRMGFFSLQRTGRTRHCGPLRPESLHSVLVERLDRFQKFLPELLSLFQLQVGVGSTIILEGQKAVRQGYEQLLRQVNPSEPYLVLSDIPKCRKLDSQFFEMIVERRAALGIKPRHLLTDSKSARAWIEKVRKLGGEGKIFPPQVSFGISMVITPRLVMIHQLVEPVHAVLIESSVITEIMMQMYDLIWTVTADSVEVR